MQKHLIPLLLIAASAHAHDVWVTSPDTLPAQQVLHADLSYSHDFPHSEEIAADRVHIFKPLELTGEKGTQTLKQSGKNYQYISNKPLKKGTYWVSATYQPTFWSKNEQGWKQLDLPSLQGASYCEQSQMFGKKLLVVGDGKASPAVFTHPIGQTLEIVPLSDPSQAKVGELLPLQVWYQGKPLAGATLTATADTIVAKDLEAAHDHREPQIFSGKTSKEGKVNLLPLTEGLWKVKVVHKTPFTNAEQCQYSVSYATLIVPIGTARASAHHEHHHAHSH